MFDSAAGAVRRDARCGLRVG